MVVGSAGELSSSDYRAVLWEADGKCQFLDDVVDPSGAGWELQRTAWINNAGPIVGWGLDPTGAEAGFLLTPVPGPATAAVLLALLFMPTGRSRRRHPAE